MKKKISATFYDENSIQKAVDELAKNGNNIDSAVVYSGGESLKNQTFKNKKMLFGSATGIEYNIWGERVDFFENLLHPTSLALLPLKSMGINHNFAADSLAVESERRKIQPPTIGLSIRLPDTKVSEARRILKKNGARKIYVS